MNWNNKDPREVIYKRNKIIIVRPNLNGSMSNVGTGYVDSKNVYCIFTSFDDYKCIDADEKWNDCWLWTRAPNSSSDIDTEIHQNSLEQDIENYDILVTTIRNILTDAGIPDHEDYPEEDIDDCEKSLRTGGRMISLAKRVKMLADKKI
jgi:hypothetical protein